MKLEPVGIPCNALTLSGLRYLPERAVKPTALLFAHGFTAGKYSLDGLAGYLAGRGYEGLTFDFVGHKLGATGGEMHRIAQAAENLEAALTWLQEQSTAQQIVMIGHSMGAAAVLATAAQRAGREAGRLAGLICLCIGVQPARGFDGAIGQAMLAQRSDYVAGAPALQLLTELETLLQDVEKIGPTPTLFVAAQQDVLVPPERVERLAERVGPSTQVKRLESSHLEAPDRARTTIAQWLEALPPPPGPLP